MGLDTDKKREEDTFRREKEERLKKIVFLIKSIENEIQKSSTNIEDISTRVERIRSEYKWPR
jgi:hypothetical protein